ncbi:alpha-ketoglutarate-dependent dioxygenase AlkB family protein [Myroides pelagicus]|uniref:Alpha-ketoglutarate-dependent dioxygenase AlkB n=1 Tax=Myroides pelagicus TaxID=270914 RepID=A0A7K1GRK0_9FLAO|nr:alpha-ketoglutarate-dependent dioxygenase AlkB [Myroides pelagicus]MEC4113857.1 alpha-ketoglutarate-dependent dioxygenase AlkB [Myroides pelagicus]MTH30644.1 alpha-ketoglutarate-dependent dioxygenase AlkB [Myroides pelagicus]
MDLFTQCNQQDENILPFDGEVLSHGFVLSNDESEYYYTLLLGAIAWQPDEAILFGKRIQTRRQVAWYGEQPFSYAYSGVIKCALPWTDALLWLKQKIETITNETYNSCLLNYYGSGDEGMAWHSDAEKQLKKNGSIAVLSLGAVRKFSFKHKASSLKLDVILEPGSLWEMKGETQTYWLHRLPPTQKVRKGRVSLTFRTIV